MIIVVLFGDPVTLHEMMDQMSLQCRRHSPQNQRNPVKENSISQSTGVSQTDKYKSFTISIKPTNNYKVQEEHK